MAKGDDAVRKKRNKVERKRLRKDSTVSARVAAIIATKRRRKDGKRRGCEGMCFSLPTPDDPFNDKSEKKSKSRKEPNSHEDWQVNTKLTSNQKSFVPRKATSVQVPDNVQGRHLKRVKVADGKNEKQKFFMPLSNERPRNPQEPENSKDGVVNDQQHFEGNTDSLSKFLVLCLTAIQNAWVQEGSLDESNDRPLLAIDWGIEFWKRCSDGSDILETSGANSSREQIAWLVSTASDIVTRKEKDGQFVASPFLLFLVPSQEKAIKVRSLCKPLKALGIHTVSLHPGASVDHQVHGLRSCEPEFLVSTPERLLELVLLKAIDISGVSLLVLDGLEHFVNGCLFDTLKAIRQCICGNPQTVIFSNMYGIDSTSMVRHLLLGSICRLSLDDSVASQSACISQYVNYTSEAEKISKAIQILKQVCGNQARGALLQILFMAGTVNKCKKLVTSLTAEGFNVSGEWIPDRSRGRASFGANLNSDDKIAISVTDEEQLVRRTDIGDFETVLLVDFPSFDHYVQTLSRMARHSANGALISLFCTADMPSAGPLIQLLEQCGQPVPDPLRTCLHPPVMAES